MGSLSSLGEPVFFETFMPLAWVGGGLFIFCRSICGSWLGWPSSWLPPRLPYANTSLGGGSSGPRTKSRFSDCGFPKIDSGCRKCWGWAFLSNLLFLSHDDVLMIYIDHEKATLQHSNTAITNKNTWPTHGVVLHSQYAKHL